jgi:hypothetical protein
MSKLNIAKHLKAHPPSDRFVVVPKKDEKQTEKAPLLRSVGPSNIKLLASHATEGNLDVSVLKQVLASAGKGSKLFKEVKVWLCQSLVTNTSSAATFQQPVVPLVPGSSAEFPSLALLFDEYKCAKAEILWYTTFSGATNGVDVAGFYSPLVATAAGAFSDVLVSEMNTGLFRTSGSNAGYAATVDNGVKKWHIKIPSTGVQRDGSNEYAGTWDATTDSTSNWGYCKWYMTAPSTGTGTISQYNKLFVHFRSRT